MVSKLLTRGELVEAVTVADDTDVIYSLVRFVSHSVKGHPKDHT